MTGAVEGKLRVHRNNTQIISLFARDWVRFAARICSARQRLGATAHPLSFARKPYRIEGVQSFGEKRAFRRTIGRLCRSGVRSSNEKSLLLLGQIAAEFTRRIPRLGQAGGAREIRTRGMGPSSKRCRSSLLKMPPRGDSVAIPENKKAAPKGGF